MGHKLISVSSGPSRKGMIEVQFNWVFIFIAGTIILLFFVGLVTKQKGYSEQKIAGNIMNSLQTITTGAKISRGTLQTIKIPDIDILFDCEDCSCEYSVSGVGKQFKDKIIFAPSKTSGRDLISWTLDWSVPFRVTNFLYLTTPRIKYYIVGNNPLAEEINRSLPSKMDVEWITTPEDLVNRNYDLIRVVVVNDPDASGFLARAESLLDETDVSLLQIGGKNMIGSATIDFGYLNFYEKKGSKLKLKNRNYAQYINKEMLFGAIFTDSYDIYRCNVRNAVHKLEFVSRVYLSRSEQLVEGFSNSGNLVCTGLYDSPISTLKSLESFAKQKYPEFLGVNFPDLRALADTQSALIRSNEDMLYNNCPVIY